MSTRLPPEIFDLIVDHLRDEPTTLKNCCLVSSSWVPRARVHLFAQVRFGPARPDIELWMATFPDPSSSPAHYTRRLSIFGLDITTLTSTGGLAWIHRFRHIVELQLKPVSLSSSVPTSLAQLRGFSPTLKLLDIYPSSIPLPELLDFICSFPLLEDLNLRFVTAPSGIDGRSVGLASPKFTGTLSIMSMDDSAARGLLALPCGLRFTKIMITISSAVGHAGLVNDLVSKCSGTLEFLMVAYYYQRSTPPSFDISKATKLKEVEFRLVGSNVQWIITTLQTARIKNIQRVMIGINPHANPTGETTRLEWQDLDYTLDRLWILHSVRPEVTYKEIEGRDSLREVALSLLPKLASKGAVRRRAGSEPGTVVFPTL